MTPFESHAAVCFASLMVGATLMFLSLRARYRAAMQACRQAKRWNEHIAQQNAGIARELQRQRIEINAKADFQDNLARVLQQKQQQLDSSLVLVGAERKPLSVYEREPILN